MPLEKTNAVLDENALDEINVLFAEYLARHDALKAKAQHVCESVELSRAVRARADAILARHRDESDALSAELDTASRLVDEEARELDKLRADRDQAEVAVRGRIAMYEEHGALQ